jgi:FlaA1/EpsC-like NDP-sugar epimerase
VVVLQKGSSRDPLGDGIVTRSSRADRVLATARRLVEDALSTVRFQTRRPPKGSPIQIVRRVGQPFPDNAPLLSHLLGRETVAFETETLRSAVADRCILVTGAAGSIGSELCRQVARLEPRVLVAFDNAESGLFHLDQDLRASLPGRFVPWVGDIRDVRRVHEVMERHSFDAVFHAAAYKHVPLMEAYPLELTQTNVFGTWNLAQAAAEHRVGRFVLISTDKAVHPANVMGLTKRVAELLLAAMANNSPGQTRFAAVRFGNVLGSSGSVVPTFHEQIARGGPLTVTHPDVRRYFMTTQEAVHLVLQTAAMADPSGTFVLDMGEPVRIIDLARQMIRAWGLEPDRDIQIHYVGLRPGEKLDEALIASGESVAPTFHPKIRALHGAGVIPQSLAAWMQELRSAIEARDETGAIAHMAGLVPEYEPGETWASVRKASAASIPAAVG